MNLSKYDEKVARSIQDKLNCTGITENAIFSEESGKENYRPRTLVDETLEYIDPTPNIYTLFVQFNEKFFWNVLLPVQVKWSPRMTSCAGTCTFHPRNKECIISLSNPLLKLRPRKDLIETLLHEMIHAYLFLTNNNRDRDGHGPVFKSHMKRINREAGTNITIYHTFHEEVRLYQQHWWRCNGPCQKRAPFFGTVRRAMNRAPGPNDFWWNEHRSKCSGQFIKIKEPEKPVKNKNAKTAPKKPEKNNILNWIRKTDDKSTVKGTKDKTSPKTTNQPKITDWRKTKNNSILNFQTDMKKLGNNTNNVHGWGTGGPTSTSRSPSPTNASSSSSSSFTKIGRVDPHSSLNNINKSFSFSGVLGGRGTGRSNLLDKYDNATVTSTSSKKNSPVESRSRIAMDQNIEIVDTIVTCPSCNEPVAESRINQHLDTCLESSEVSKITPSGSNNKRKLEDTSTPNKIFKTGDKSSTKQIECPLCSKKVKPDNFNDHLENCLKNDSDETTDDVIILDSSSTSINLHDSPHVCLICNKLLEPNVSLNVHLEECVASVFHDSTIHDDDNDGDNNADNNDNDDDNFDESTSDRIQVPKKFPCPVCMTLVQESLMNDHLDICLKKIG